MDSLKPLLAVYTSILFFMLVLSTLLYRNQPNRHFRNLRDFWFAIFVFFVWVTLTSTAPLKIVATNMLLWYWNIAVIIRIMGDSVGVDVRRKWHFPLACVAYGISIAAFFNDMNFYWLTVPTVLAMDAITFHALYLVGKKWKEIGVVQKILWFCVLSFAVHMNDYPYVRQFNEYAVFGFAYFVFNIFAFAITLPVVVLDRFHRETSSELERLVKERSQQLVQQTKMASLGRMAGGVAHEINNPLMVVTSNVYSATKLIDSGTPDLDALSRCMERISRSAERIKHIVASLIAFAVEGREGDLEKQSLASLVEQAALFFGERFRQQGVRLMLPEKNADIVVAAKPAATVQVISNLLQNALDAVEGLSEKWIRIEIARSGQNTILSVIDSGKGLSEDVALHVFDPFFTTKEVGKGIGLGLGTSQGIMRRQNGDLLYDSSHPNTKFDVVFAD